MGEGTRRGTGSSCCLDGTREVKASEGKSGHKSTGGHKGWLAQNDGGEKGNVEGEGGHTSSCRTHLGLRLQVCARRYEHSGHVWVPLPACLVQRSALILAAPAQGRGEEGRQVSPGPSKAAPTQQESPTVQLPSSILQHTTCTKAAGMRHTGRHK